VASRVAFNVPKDKIRKKILSNGMTLISYATAHTPKVLVQIAYDVGSAVEEQGEKGLAHLVEHMIFKGTNVLQEGAIDAIARKYGATFNAFTSNDETSYYFEVDRENWKNFVPMLADCMKNALFDKEHLASELKAVVQELNMYRDKHMSRMVQQAFQIAYPANHPYHHPVIGYKEDLASLDAQVLKNFYKKYYHPERAVLFIVGDIDADDAVSYAEKYFADIPNGGTQEFNKFPDYVHDLTVHGSRIYEHVQQEQAVFYWVIPGLKTGCELVVQAIKSVLGGGEGSRLYRALVDDAKVADDVGVEGYQMKHGGLFLIMLEPKRGKLDRCREIIIAEMTNLALNGISEIERQKFVSRQVSQFVRSVESLEGLVYEWIESYFLTRDEFDVFAKADRVYDVTGDDVKQFVATHLDPFLMSFIEVVPFIPAKAAFWQRAQEHVKAVEAHILAAHERTTELVEPELPAEFSHPVPLNFTFPRPTSRHTLANGLEIIMSKDDSLPLATMVLQLRDGTHYSASKEGRLVSTMMGSLLEGSTKYSKQELLDFFEIHGVSYRLDSYGISASVVASEQMEVFDRILHMALNPVFEPKAMEHVKQLSIAGMERSKDSPSDVAVRMLKNEIYKGTDNEWTADEMISILKKVTSRELHAIHSAVLRPESMVVSIAGQFDEQAILALLTKYLGALPGGTYVPKRTGANSFETGKKIDFVMHRDQVFLIMGQPSTVTLKDSDYLPLHMLNLIAFYALGSRLYALREQTGLFYNASGGMASGATDEPGHDSVYAIVNPNTLDQAEEGIREMFASLARNGVTEEEMHAAQQMTLKKTIDLIATTAERASLFAGMEVLDLPEDYYDSMIARVNAMTVDELNLVAKKYFDTSKMVRIRVGLLPK
jgi:zinc protease